MAYDVIRNLDGSFRFKVDVVTVKIYRYNLNLPDGIILRTQIEGDPMWYLALLEDGTCEIYWDWIPNSKICDSGKDSINRINEILMTNRRNLIDTLNVIKIETLLD